MREPRTLLLYPILDEEPLFEICRTNKSELGVPKIWLTAKEAAAYLCTTKGGIYNLVYRGRLRPFYRGRIQLYKRTELDQFIESSRKGSFYGYSRSH